MKIIRDANEMRAWSREKRATGQSLGLIPTMGALHEGHLTLARAAVQRDDAVIMSVFVNPAQFAPHEDFDAYPRTMESDCEKAKDAYVDVIYAPKASDMYLENYATYVEVERLQDELCGKSRPHFFKGVATVVTKLFNATDPDRAYFGEKDGQQSAVIRRMTRDLDFGIEIVTIPTVREADGLAMSSRNAYLSEEERERALCIRRALRAGKQAILSGERDPQRVVQTICEGMKELDIDYVNVVDADEITPSEIIEGTVMLAVAAHVGETRLIDNVRCEV